MVMLSLNATRQDFLQKRQYRDTGPDTSPNLLLFGSNLTWKLFKEGLN